jgi:hypothetical protein
MGEAFANDSDEISTAKAEPGYQGGLADGGFGPQGEQYAGNASMYRGQRKQMRS